MQTQQRHRRDAVPVPTIALVGYTNAGKSTLFNRLTRPDPASSRMFATLDPKLRALVLPSREGSLIGHGRASFVICRTPLLLRSSHPGRGREGGEVLLHVQDCSSLEREQQKEEVEKVLALPNWARWASPSFLF